MPSFVLPDAHGIPHRSGDCMGENGLLVVFACNHCPFVVHLADSLGKKALEWMDAGVRTLAIVSNDLEAYPQDGPEAMIAFAKRHGWEFPYLLDETQDVALAFGAACTPDFFLFDASGRLRYSGQFDDTRPKSDVPATGAVLHDEVTRMLEGSPTSPVWAPASGCSIKWKPDKQPLWWNLG